MQCSILMAFFLSSTCPLSNETKMNKTLFYALIISSGRRFLIISQKVKSSDAYDQKIYFFSVREEACNKSQQYIPDFYFYNVCYAGKCFNSFLKIK